MSETKIPTPRTDGEVRKRSANGAYDPRFVYADFARQLERENAAMRKVIQETLNVLLQVSEARIFCAESMDIDSYLTDDVYAAIAKLQPFIN
jgi:hypothetical protein